jgi:hypothetical protein
MKNVQIFLLLLGSFSAMAQYHPHRADVSTLLQRKLAKTQPAPVTTAELNVSQQASLTASNAVVPEGANDWKMYQSPVYAGSHRLQSTQSFDTRGNVVDSRAAFSLISKKRK